MLGLAVGIDYALFIVSRHRQQLNQGMELADSVATAVATAGSAVVFAGLTVFIALAGMALGQWLRQRMSVLLFRRSFFVGLGLLGAYMAWRGIGHMHH